MTVKELSETAEVSGAASALVQENSTPSSYLDSLEKQELYEDAIRFLAYKLPTKAGVKWASSCIKEMSSPESKKEKDAPLEASDQWLKAQDDPTRYAAKDAADAAKKAGPSNMLAMAVFLSGGSMSPPGSPQTPPPPYLAQKMISSTVRVVVMSHEPQKAAERYKQALKIGKALDTPGA